MSNPYKIDGPTCLSFSGGRTSAYMLWQVLQNNTPEDIRRWLVVCFANTGLEHERTLEFVRACGQHFGVLIVWVEYRDSEAGFAIVDFDTASRRGEPFVAIVRKRNYLPNPITRFCTSELKIRAMHKMLQSMGFDRDMDMMTGIRADEPSRVAKIRARRVSSEGAYEMRMPLADAGISVHDVDAFWKAQPFNLELATYGGRTLEGNCILCFLKPFKQVQSLIRKDRSYPVVWIAMEGMVQSAAAVTGDGDRFRNDRPSYAQMLDNAERQGELFAADVGADLLAAAAEQGIDCFCGD